MDGWIKLYRKIKDHWVWDDKPFSKGQAWIDIILRCNHKCVQQIVDGNVKWILRGQFLYSNVKLANDWGWTESSVRRFIKLLTCNDMLTATSTNKYTIYEVINFAELQALDIKDFESATWRTDDEQMTNKRRANDEQMTTDNNDKNNKNDNNKKHTCVSDECDTPAENPPVGGGAQVKPGKGEYTHKFEEFWRHYPRRIEKKGAFKVWNTRIKQGITPETLINAAKGYAASCKQKKTDEQYIKHPSTFLGPTEPYMEYLNFKPPDKPKGQVILE